MSDIAPKQPTLEISGQVFTEPFFKSHGPSAPGRVRIWDTLHRGWWPKSMVGVCLPGYVAPKSKSLKDRILGRLGMFPPTEFWHFQRRRMPLFGAIELEAAISPDGDRRIQLELAKARPGPNRTYVRPTVAFLIEDQEKTLLAEMLGTVEGMIYPKKTATIRIFGDDQRDIVISNSENHRWITDGQTFRMRSEPHGIEYASGISTELAIAVCMFATSRFASSD